MECKYFLKIFAIIFILIIGSEFGNHHDNVSMLWKRPITKLPMSLYQLCALYAKIIIDIFDKLVYNIIISKIFKSIVKVWAINLFDCRIRYQVHCKRWTFWLQLNQVSKTQSLLLSQSKKCLLEQHVSGTLGGFFSLTGIMILKKSISGWRES